MNQSSGNFSITRRHFLQTGLAGAGLGVPEFGNLNPTGYGAPDGVAAAMGAGARRFPLPSCAGVGAIGGGDSGEQLSRDCL